MIKDFYSKQSLLVQKGIKILFFFSYGKRIISPRLKFFKNEGNIQLCVRYSIFVLKLLSSYCRISSVTVTFLRYEKGKLVPGSQCSALNETEKDDYREGSREPATSGSKRQAIVLL